MTFSELIAVYLFLGGTAAGAFAVTAVADVFVHAQTKKRLDGRHGPSAIARAFYEPTHQRIRCIVYGVSLATIAAGVLCLVADLGKPDLFYYLMMYPTTSYVSIGALALSVCAACMAMSLADAAFVLPPAARRIALAAKTVGVPVAVVVMVYTGLLLKSVIAVGFWQSGWLPVLFFASAGSCGCAVAMLAACSCEDRRAVSRWRNILSWTDIPLVALEAVAAVAFFVQVVPMADSSAMRSLFFGAHAPAFWLGFVGCGILLPLGIELPRAFASRGLSEGMTAVAAGLVLAGGLCLRLVVVASGVQTAVA